MALSIGQLLGGAGVIARRQRETEEAERIARQNQLLIEEKNRFDELRRIQTRQAGELGVPQAPSQFVGFENIGAAPVAPVAPAAAPAAVSAPAPAAPTAPAAAPAPSAAPAGDQYEALYERVKGLNRGGLLGRLSYSRDLNMLTDKRAFSDDDIARIYAIALSKQDDSTANALQNILMQRGLDPNYVREIGYTTRRGLRTLAGAKREEEAAAAAADERRRLFELKTGRKVGTATADEVLTPGIQRPENFERIASAVMQVESGGDPNAVSPKGALGTMQTMPGTLASPGFGVTPARDRSPQEMERVGKDYLAAMINEFKGNLDHALAAYNWGPANAKEWITRGANVAELPAETRSYIQKVKSLLGGAVEALIPTAAAAPAPAAAPAGVQTAARTESPSTFYAANPQNIGPDRQNLDSVYNQQRARLSAQYNALVQSGMGPQANQLVGQVMELDQKYRAERLMLDGMEALAQLEYGNDPRAISQVLSFYRGQPITFEPTAEGAYRMSMQDQQGNMQVRGVYNKDQVGMMARQYFDKNYLQAQQAFMSEVAKMRLESELKQQEGISAQQAQMIRESTVEIIKGNVGAQARAGEFVVTNMGDGRAVISNKSGTKAYIIDTTTGQTAEIDGVTVPVAPSATAVAGMGR